MQVWGMENRMEMRTKDQFRGGLVSHLGGGESESDLYPVVLYLGDDQDGRTSHLLAHVVHHFTGQLLPGSQSTGVEKTERQTRREKDGRRVKKMSIKWNW